jgi:AcrR family transcriptional regulator
MTDSRAPRRDAAENREALLEAARVLLNRDPATSLESIATYAGLSRRTMYGHFPNRDALLAALAETGTRRVVEAVAAVDHADPVVRLALIAAAAWDHVAAIRAMTVMTLSSGRMTIVERGLAPLRLRIADTLTEGAGRGLRDDIPPARLARIVEDAVIALFPTTIRDGLDADSGRDLVVRIALGVVGLGAADTAALLAEHPEITAPRPRVDELWPPTAAIPVIRERAAAALAADAAATADAGAPAEGTAR